MAEHDTKCGCGKAGRYAHFDDGGIETLSCNKYTRCLTYDEQHQKLAELATSMFRYENALRKIVDVNGMDYEYKAWAKEALS